MALDRQSIERRDFPVGRRGYEPDAVDQHLSALADEIEQLKVSARRRTDTLANSASDQVRAIVEAAEASAAEIQRAAEADAREIREEAAAEARATRAAATQSAGGLVEAVSESTESMLARLSSMQTELDSLIGSLRGGAGRLSADLGAMHGDLSEARLVAPSAFEPEPAGEDPELGADVYGEAPEEFVADEYAAETDPAPEADFAEPEPGFELEPDPGDGGYESADVEGAQLIALNMALNGTPREETARYLDENFALPDSGGLLDEVYASVGAA